MTTDYSQDGKIVFDKDLVTTKTIKTRDGSITGLTNEFLKRVDTGAYERPQAGVEYFSPDQNMGFGDKVIRKYFSASNGTTLNGTTITGFSKLIGQGGRVSTSGSIQQPFPWHDGTSSTFAFYISTGLVIGSSWTGECSIWIDYVLTVEPSTSPGALIQPITDPTVLQRVDDGTWETAQVGVQYFSPFQNGLAFGKIVREFYESDGSTGNSLLETGFSATKRLVGTGGGMYAAMTTGNEQQITANTYYSAATNASIFCDSDGDLYVYRGDTYNDADDTFKVWADYYLLTPPTLSPTGQPFADPSSPLMKRVDTGLYEIPQAGELYYAKDQSIGSGEPVVCQLVSGTGASGYITTAIADSMTLKKSLKSEGSYFRDGETYSNNFYSSSTTFVRTKIVESTDSMVIELGSNYGSSNAYDFWFFFTINEL